MLDIILHGSEGRMGMVLQQIIADTSDMRVVCGIDANCKEKRPYPVFSSPKECNIPGDVVIDFSHYTAVNELLEYCSEKKLAVVVATTALTNNEKQAMQEASASTAVFNSFNMSLGINAIAGIMNKLVPFFEENFDIEIVEKHHNKKVDSPSGTALLLADAINDACLNKKDYVYGRHGADAARTKDELGIHAVRGGTIPGEHTIIFAGPDEIIEITHTAMSRNIFAQGAVNAARFIAKKEKGLYSMKELIAEK